MTFSRSGTKPSAAPIMLRRCSAPEDRDHLWEDLMALKTRILRASSIDETLRAWSEGILGEKTFQQVTEEFAEIVIPKVWQREGKKVSKVSAPAIDLARRRCGESYATSD